MSPGAHELDAAALRRALEARARELGFHGFGVAPAAPLAEHREFLAQWLAAGYAGEMHYMAEQEALRADPQHLLPGARSVVCVLVDYGEGLAPPAAWGLDGAPRVDGEASSGAEDGAGGVAPIAGVALPPTPQRPGGKVARYARSRDYHIVLRKRLKALGATLQELAPGAAVRPCVDSAPLLERAYAWRAGLGFLAKNSMLITQGVGSYTLLGELLTDVELPADEPQPGTCGRCTRCLDACPTDALVAPGELDARRCISFWTIEHKGALPADADLHGWALGCDICQEVCPYNHGVDHPDLAPDFATPRAAGPFVEAAAVRALADDSAYHQRYAGTPMMRPGRAGMLRNLERLAGGPAPGGDEDATRSPAHPYTSSEGGQDV